MRVELTRPRRLSQCECSADHPTRPTTAQYSWRRASAPPPPAAVRWPISDDRGTATLQQLCADAVVELGLWGASVTVMTTVGCDVVAASDEETERLENLQFVLGEGPTAEAFDSRQPVLVHDVATAGRSWVQFANAAHELGIAAAYAFPLQLGAVRLGVLTAYCTSDRTLGPVEVGEGLRLAEVARDVLLDTFEHRPGQGSKGLARSLPLRTQVYQAQGMLMVALEIDLAEALVRLRAMAYAEELDLNQLAAELVSGRRPMPSKDFDAR